jgi:hypothetical protein
VIFFALSQGNFELGPAIFPVHGGGYYGEALAIDRADVALCLRAGI